MPSSGGKPARPPATPAAAMAGEEEGRGPAAPPPPFPLLPRTPGGGNGSAFALTCSVFGLTAHSPSPACLLSMCYVLPCQATGPGPPAHREGGAQRSLPLHHAPMTGRTASRLAGSSPALGLNAFIIVLPVGSKAINGRSTDYLDGRSVFLPAAHHPGDEGIGARLLALCLWKQTIGHRS
jgi:hypothetical protein